MNRLAWKTALIDHITAQMAAKPVPLPEKIDHPEQWEFRRVSMAGKFLYRHEFLIKPRTLDGVNGYHMVVPFKRASGGIVFVNRGWISDDLMKKAVRPDGMVTVEGIVQVPHKSTFTPENDLLKNDWYWPDLNAMADASHFEEDVAPVIVNVAAKKEGLYPMGGQMRLDIPNDHKQYAIFWYVMALVLLGVYVLSQMKDDKYAGL